MADLNQIGCREWRKQNGRLKKDVYFWDLHNEELMRFYRCLSAKKSIQVDVNNEWRDMSKHIKPFLAGKRIVYLSKM